MNTFTLKYDTSINDLDNDIKVFVLKTISSAYLICGDSLSNKFISRKKYGTVQILNIGNTFINVKKLTEFKNQDNRIVTMWAEYTDKTLCFNVSKIKPVKFNSSNGSSKNDKEKKKLNLSIDRELRKYIGGLSIGFYENKKIDDLDKEEIQSKFQKDGKAWGCIKTIIYKLMKRFSFTLLNTQFNVCDVYDNYFIFECTNIGANIMIDKLYREFMLLSDRAFKSVQINFNTNSLRFKVSRGVKVTINTLTTTLSNNGNKKKNKRNIIKLNEISDDDDDEDDFDNRPRKKRKKK